MVKIRKTYLKRYYFVDVFVLMYNSCQSYTSLSQNSKHILNTKLYLFILYLYVMIGFMFTLLNNNFLDPIPFFYWEEGRRRLAEDSTIFTKFQFKIFFLYIQYKYIYK